jgi:hypothetical protein
VCERLREWDTIWSYVVIVMCGGNPTKIVVLSSWRLRGSDQ